MRTSPLTMLRVPTAPLAAAGLICGYAVAVLSGSRPLGGVVLAIFGISCIALWLRRDGGRTASLLSAFGLTAFALSHLLGLAIGGWAAVLAAAATAAICWRVSDSPWRASRHASRQPDSADRVDEALDRPHTVRA